MKKVLVSLPDEIVNMVDTELNGKLGEGRSDTLRTIIMNWLGEKGYLAKGDKPHE
jgi:metal-responsive CopG/Arc/MetJ family transcriptional regulator